MTSSAKDNTTSVAMYISSFYPTPMGGMEMQGLRLAKQLAGQGVKVTIFTHGFRGCKKQDVHEGVEVRRLYSWMNVLWERVRGLKQKLASGPAPVPETTKPVSGRSVLANKADVDIRINGNFFDLLYYLIQLVNFVGSIGWKKKYQVIHVHGVPWVSFVGVMAGRLCSLPVLVKESTTIGLKKYDSIILGKWMRRQVLRYAHFVAISRYIQQVVLAYGVPARRIHYVPNGVNMAARPLEEVAGAMNVLFVGNLSQGPAKGLDVLLEAWRSVVHGHPRAMLLIAGNNKNQQQWAEVLDDWQIMEHVSFLGSLNDLGDVYGKTTVFVSPSRREGLSNALLEAMAHGLPCVVTNISGSQDLIEHGSSGLVVEPDDAAGLSQALNQMLSAPEVRSRMRVRAYNKVKENCSFDKVTAAYCRIYSSLIQKTLPADVAAEN